MVNYIELFEAYEAAKKERDKAEKELEKDHQLIIALHETILSLRGSRLRTKLMAPLRAFLKSQQRPVKTKEEGEG